MSTESTYRAGAVAVVGRPNVGKSTLVNALVGYKVAIVSPKAQTTRHRILGVATDDDAQYVLLDTPGLHPPTGKAINRVLNRTARGALGEASVALLVLEAGRWTDADAAAAAVVRDAGLPLVVALNKIDRLPRRDQLLPLLQQLGARLPDAELVPVSALKADGLVPLKAALRRHLPESGPLFDADTVTDRSERFLVAELIREQVVLQLRDELPHAATVAIEAWEEGADLLRLGATIWVEREGQKGIVVGAGGERIKRIGSVARRSIEAQLGRRVHLELWVKVRADWSDDEAALRRFGYGE